MDWNISLSVSGSFAASTLGAPGILSQAPNQVKCLGAVGQFQPGLSMFSGFRVDNYGEGKRIAG